MIAITKAIAFCPCEMVYTCGKNDGSCSDGTDACITTHARHQCGHIWDGPIWTSPDGKTSSRSCKCGSVKVFHDAAWEPDGGR